MPAHRLPLSFWLKNHFFPSSSSKTPSIEFHWTEAMYLSLNPISETRKMENEFIGQALVREPVVSLSPGTIDILDWVILCCRKLFCTL